MGKQDLISVIIPAYNAESTIRRACRSVLEQSYGNVQVIVVNDGSTDGTDAVLQELCRETPNLLTISQSNGGVSKARNTGLDAAEGEFIAFLDADDELLPGILETQRKLLSDYACDMVACPCQRMRPDGSSFFTTFPIPGELSVWEGEEAFNQTLRDHPVGYAVWGKLYRAEILRDVRFVEGRKLHEDSFFLFELFRKNPKVVLTQVPAVRYHMVPESASRSAFSEKYLDVLYFANRKYEIVCAEYPQLIPLGKNVLVKACMSFLNNTWKEGAERFRDAERQCLRAVRENAEFFIPAIRTDYVRIFAIRAHLFWLYKWLCKIRRH